MDKILIGSRGSILALAQAKYIKERLSTLYPNKEFEIKVITTSGDKDLMSHWNNSNASLKSFFTKEIERDLLNGDIDLAVHSMKDMPAVSPPNLMCGAIPNREDVRDVIISTSGLKLEDLPSGSVIGTSSLRRAKNIEYIRPDLVIKPLRGNIHTRIDKLNRGEYDAIVLAAAGLIRVGLQSLITEYLDPHKFLPAPAQGALYIQCRENDEKIRKILAPLNDEKVAKVVAVEREFSKIFDGGCHTPMGCYSKVNDDKIDFYGVYYNKNSRYEASGTGKITTEIAKIVADIIKDGAKGKVYIVGSGPGDIELLTLKAKRVLQNADIVVYDRLVNPRILDFAKNGELIYLGKENTAGGIIQDEINNTLVEKARLGKTVVRLKGGDPFVFGRGGEEILALRKYNIPFEVIPGITSAISVPAYAGIPVTHRNIARSFHIFTGHTMENGKWHNFEAISKLDGTLVFLMGIKNLEIITSDLIKNGKHPKTPVAIIEKGATSREKITIGNLENIVNLSREKKVVPPAIIVIGDVVNLRNEFNWYEKMPLFGKKVLITRDKKHADEFATKIEKLGGEARILPFIEIESTKNKIPDLKEYSAILFNSANGVREFFKKIDDIRILGDIKIGVVGSKTKSALEQFKLKSDFMPTKYTVDELARISQEFTEKGDKILIITSDISPCDTDKYKKLYDRDFEKLEIYKTKKITYDKDFVEKNIKDIDIITFMSSSTVDAFMNSIKNVPNAKFSSIGPMTSKTMKKYGLPIDYEAKIYDIDGMIESIKEK